MSFKRTAIALAVAATMAMPVPAFAFITCGDLPEYARAIGVLQGLSTCDMTVAEARRVVAAQGGSGVYEQPAPPAPYHHRRHRPRTLQQ